MLRLFELTLPHDPHIYWMRQITYGLPQTPHLAPFAHRVSLNDQQVEVALWGGSTTSPRTIEDDPTNTAFPVCKESGSQFLGSSLVTFCNHAFSPGYEIDSDHTIL